MTSTNNFSQHALQSLDELIGPVLTFMQEVEEEQNFQEPYFAFMAIGSRGSIPFYQALVTAIDKGHLPKTRLEVVPHIFSIENLEDILIAGGVPQLTFPQAQQQPGRDPSRQIYQEIANKFRVKLDDVRADQALRLGRKNAVLIDLDEVNTGSNLSERSKIYSQIELPTNIHLYVASFTGTQGHNIKEGMRKKIRQVMATWADNIHHKAYLAKNPISWSDNELFFDKVGVKYPGIAAPVMGFVPNLVKNTYRHDSGELRSGQGFFYKEFFSAYSTEIARQFNTESSQFRLIGISDQELFDSFSEEENILSWSANSLTQAINKCEEEGILKRALSKQEYSINTQQGQVTNARSGAVVLTRKPDAKIGLLSGVESYRHPFVLLLDEQHEGYERLQKHMCQYFKYIASSRNNQQK